MPTWGPTSPDSPFSPDTPGGPWKNQIKHETKSYILSCWQMIIGYRHTYQRTSTASQTHRSSWTPHRQLYKNKTERLVCIQVHVGVIQCVLVCVFYPGLLHDGLHLSLLGRNSRTFMSTVPSCTHAELQRHSGTKLLTFRLKTISYLACIRKSEVFRMQAYCRILQKPKIEW